MTLPGNNTIEEARRKMVGALRGKPLTESFERLIQALGDESWRVRKEAVDVLLSSRLGITETNRLIQLLRDEDNAGLRNSTAELLMDLGSQVAPLLLVYREDPDHDLRKLVVDILGNVGGAEAVSGLVQSLRDQDMNVAAAAAEGLGRVGNSDVIPALLQALEESSEDFLNFNIIAALANIGTPGPLPAVISRLAENPMLKRPLLDCLGQIGGDQAAARLVLGELKSTLPSIFRSAVIALERIARQLDASGQQMIITQLKKYLAEGFFDACTSTVNADDHKLNKALLSLFKKLADPKPAPALIRMLAMDRYNSDAEQALRVIGNAAIETALAMFPTADESVRAAISGFVVTAPATEQTRKLVACAMQDESALVRSSAALAAAKICITSPELTMQIAELLEDHDHAVREAALHSLTQCVAGSESLIKNLAERLYKSEEPARRKDAATLFAALAEEERISVLLKDEDPSVREAAVRAIGAFHLNDSCGLLAMALVDEDTDVRIAAAESLGVTISNSASIKSLRLALKDQDSWVQAQALRSLASLASDQILEDVKDLWQRGDEIAQLACLEVLGRIAAPEGMQMVAESIGKHDGEVLKGCIQLLARHDLSLLKPWLNHLVSHRNWSIRLETVRASASLTKAEQVELLETAVKIEAHDLVKKEMQTVLSHGNAV